VATIARSNVDDMLAELRTQYDYIVIDGGDLPNNGFGLLFVTAADGVLLSFRTGRKQLVADRLMLETLERSEAKVIGAVMNDQASIDRFNDDDASVQIEPVAVEVPAPAPAYSGPIAGLAGSVLTRIGRAN
jgi:cellulose biosynthesis protein BcsQ